MTEWTSICRVDDIPVLGSRRVARAQGLDVAVFGTSVACPMHNWTIGLCDGQAAAPDEGCTPKFQVRVEDGTVLLNTHELAHHALSETRPIAGPQRRTPATPAA